MGKANNLGDFMTDLADAIREKTGTTEPINPQDFSDTIKGIQSGGGAVKNDVTFYDYDGVILRSYTKDDFLALTAMPELPTRKGLICQGWNWDLEAAKSQVTECDKCDIGATYITDDGKTRLYIRIAAEGRMDVPLKFSQTIANGVAIDWGDGSAVETLSGTGEVTTEHHYNAPGCYIIGLSVSDNCNLVLSGLSTVGSGTAYRNMIEKIEFGSGVKTIAGLSRHYSLSSIVIPQEVTSISSNAFQNCYSLHSIVIPKGVTTLNSYILNYCYSLTLVVIPQGVTSISSNVFQYCYSLSSIVIPQGVTSINSYAFNYCYSLASIVLPQRITNVNSNSFQYCESLASIVIPQGVTQIGSSAFASCPSLASVVFPQSVTSILKTAFQYCYSLGIADFSALTAVPSLSNTNSFSSMPTDCKVVVPDALYDEWIAATNWSTYADRIIKKSDWDVQNT